MELDPQNLAEIIDSFAVATGVPAFLMDASGTIVQASSGFPQTEYAFADFGELPSYFDSEEKLRSYSRDQYYSIYTEHGFVFSFVRLDCAGACLMLFCGPARFTAPTDEQLVVLLKDNQISLRARAETADRIAKLPRVAVRRLAHLGRVLWSLSHAYCDRGVNITPDMDSLAVVENDPGDNGDQITFNLVDEGTHSTFVFLQLTKRLLLSGDVAGVRALRDRNISLPADRLFGDDALLSVRFRTIEGMGAWAGMLFDQNVPYEQLWIILDKYTRQARTENTIPGLFRLVYECMEAFAWLVRKYSTQQHSKPIRQVVQYIQSHMATRISLDQLAQLTGLSASYLSRLIKKETGSSLVELIDSYRIEESKFMLRNTDYSIQRIAEMLGFAYQNHFTLRFKKYTGMTPSYYRRTA